MDSIASGEKASTFPALFKSQAERLGNKKISIREKDYGIWQSYSWAEAWKRASEFALGLAALGFHSGDRLCIVGDNRPELYWGMLAAQCLGGEPVPLYQDSIEREMEYIVSNVEARFAFVEDQEQVDKMIGIKDNCSHLEIVIYKDSRGLRNYRQDYLHSYESVREKGVEFAASHPGYLDAEIAKVQPDDVAVICYTSGTTGAPKGTLLSHDNFIYSSRRIIELEGLSSQENETILAYLPMAWAGDLYMSYGLSIAGGYTVCCPESSETVMNDLREIGPSFFFAPPRIWENLLTTVMIRMDDAGAIKRKMFHYFIGLASRMQKQTREGQSPGWLDRLLYQLGKILVFGPVLDNLGMSRMRVAYTAGEAMGPEIFNFFRSLGINIKQIYAMTEAGIYISIPATHEIRPDSCGPPVPWIEVKIGDNREVLVKGRTLFQGYLKNEKANKEAFEGEYFKTGDAGFIDHEGFLRIIDRAKDIGKLNDGTLFAPKYIENKLKFSPFIKEAVTVGQGRPYVALMVCIDPESVGNWAERRNLAYSSYTDLAQKPEVIDLITREVEKVNQSLSEEEELVGAQIRKFLILHKELDPDDEELTRTRKVRRGFVADKYADLISALYSDQNHVQTEAQVTYEDGRQATIKADLAIRTLDREMAGAA